MRARRETAAIPARMAAGWMEGIAKPEAAAYARGFCERWFDAPDACFWAVFPLAGGWAWEAHEGGPGRACLPSVVAALGAGGRVVVSTLTRDCEFLPKGEGFEFLILPEADDREPPTDGVAFESPMSPLRETGRTALAVGVALAACGTAALAAAAALWLLREPVKMVAEPTVREIPLTQMGRLLDVPAESYVDELRFGPDGWAVKLEKAPAAAGDEGGGQGGAR